MPDVPIVVLGGGGVGKSCLTIQYVQGHFVGDYDATIEDVYRKTIHLDDTPAVLTVVDTAGQDAFGALRDQYLRKGSGFVLVYSITDPESLQHARRIYAHLQRVRSGRSTACVLVGNKVDQGDYRAVSHEAGSQLAAEIGAVFLEITAKDHAMCESVFKTLLCAIRSGEGDASTAVDGSGGAAHGGGAGVTAAGGASGGADDTIVGAKKKKKKRHSFCTLM